MFRRIFGIAVLLACCMGVRAEAAPADVAKAQEAFERVDALFAEWNRPDSPGAALGLIYDGEFLYRKGYGSANLDHQIPMDADSVFYIASTSKQFAAAAMVLLSLDGKLSLDDDVRKYIPEVPDFGDTITIRQLIHHTSGLRDYLSLMELSGESFEDYFDQQHGLEIIARQKALNFRPNEQYVYSNSGYELIPIVVERVTGKSMNEFCAERIFTPLGMTVTRWDDDRAAVVRNRVISYYGTAENGFKQYMKNFDAIGSGGLLTCVNDLAKWDRNFYDPKVGGQPFLDAMIERAVLNDGKVLTYASGLAHDERHGLKYIGHSGGMLGFRTEFIRFPEQKFSVILLSNLGSIDPTALALKVADVFLNPAGEEAATVEEVGTAPATFVVPEDELRAKRGDYFDETTGDLWKISVWQDRLRIVRLGAPQNLIPIAPARFRVEQGETEIEFDASGSAAPTMFNVFERDRPARRFNSVKRPELTESELDAYVGSYYSVELDATFEIVREKSRLLLRRAKRPEMRLAPIVADRFEGGEIHLVFDRDDSSEVNAFRIDTRMNGGRVQGLEFVRK